MSAVPATALTSVTIATAKIREICYEVHRTSIAINVHTIVTYIIVITTTTTTTDTSIIATNISNIIFVNTNTINGS